MIQDSRAAICSTCGTQFEPGARPERCPICEDERQYVPPAGQNWTSITELADEGHENKLVDLDDNIYSVHTEPRFAIGQRAIVIRTGHGNLLWDSISFLDEATVEAIQSRGGIDIIAVSHPHFYASMVTWSRTFGDVPIYLPESSRSWICRSSGKMRFWEGSTLELLPEISLHRTGGHFECSQVALWSAGSQGRGALFTADEPMVNPGCDSVSLMHSFPNYIPLNAELRRQVHTVLEGLAFDRLYSGWAGREILQGAKRIIEDSDARYERVISAAV